MIQLILKKILGTKNQRELKRLQPRVQAINALEPRMQALSDAELRAQTDEFRRRLAGGAALEDLLVEAFAVCREASRRVLNMRHFDVQLMGGMVLHQGKIAEMATGEGKTLVATLPVYLNALEGKGVHVVTVNDYLAKRDTQWMGPLYHALGLSVAVIQGDDPSQPRRVGQRLSFLFDPTFQAPDPRYRSLRPITRQEAYRADVTYGTNNEFGFDYLRDNMVTDLAHMVQRELHYAIVDEVDNILIDEARTPLIISGPSEESTELYAQINSIIPRLKLAATIAGGKMYEVEATAEGDFIVDEKAKTVALTEQGVRKVEGFLGVKNLYDPAHMDLVHHVTQALKAHTLFQRDRDYVVQEVQDDHGRAVKQVVIVDEFTGRLMPGRRWSDGLHQAVEAKEGVRIEQENQTLATITFQNYFRMYKKLAGMTGTADTEAEEFAKIYKLDVVVIPTNRPLIRVNHPDVVFKTEREKYDAVVEEIAELYGAGRPVLVGTTSIEKSEKLSRLLQRKGIPHNVLNAKQHEREAEIVAQAGRLHAVTISTNMAGRGTDILLGGNPKFLAAELVRRGDLDKGLRNDPEYPAVLAELEQQQRYGLLEVPDLEAYALAMVTVRRQTRAEHEQVRKLGGLHILGTERHEARRIDNQLRGRAGRQGDPGSSRFYLSLEDDLMRLFVQDRMARIMERLGMQEGEAIEHPMVTKAIATAQRRVEAHNFEIRKHLLEYDDVMNTQRQVIYAERRKILEGTELREHVLDVASDVLDGLLELYSNAETHPEEWDLAGLAEAMKRQFGLEVPVPAGNLAELTQGALRESLWEKVQAAYAQKEAQLGPELMRLVEKEILLGVVDSQWKDHLLAMDHLKEGIGLRGYGQKDPLIEYKREGFDMFEAMVERIKEQSIERLFRFDIQVILAPEEGGGPEPAAAGMPLGGRHAAPGPATRPGGQPRAPGPARGAGPLHWPPARRRWWWPGRWGGTTRAPAGAGRNSRSAAAPSQGRPPAPPGTAGTAGEVMRKPAVVLPTYNERARLASVAQAILGLGLDLEVVVVDDASPDGTGPLAEAMAGRDQRLHVIHRAGPRSYARAILEGVRFALKGDCDCVVTMDADGSHDPHAIPGLVRAADDFDVVLGSRYLDGVSVVNWSLPRVVASFAANTYVRCVTGLRFMDATTGFRVYRRQVLEALGLEGITASGFAFLIEMAYRSHRMGFRVGETPIIFYGGHSPRSRLGGPLAVLEAAVHTIRLRARPVPPARRLP